MNRTLLAPLAFLYGTAVAIRNKMFDWGWIRSRGYDIPVVCVGNLTVGGTGKTPVTEMLVAHLKKEWKVAVLSRGYKRRTKGYREVAIGNSFLDVGDEAKQVKIKFPDVVVAVCEKRAEGIDRIREEHPEVNLILLDDGFQHRRVEPWVNIILIDYTRPIYKDHMLPWGNLRDGVSQLHRARYVVMTKCQPDINPLERRIVRKSLKLYPYQSLYFTSTDTGEPYPLFSEGAGRQLVRGDRVIAMSGIGNPASFRACLEARYNVVGALEFPDHHPYRRRDLETMQRALDAAPDGAVIVTTEKDAVKLRNSKKIPLQLRERLWALPVRIEFNEDSHRDFLKKLDNDVRTNPKDSFLCP